MKTKMEFPNINDRRPEGKKEDGSPYRVLVIDDSMFVTKQITQILTSEGFEIVGTATDGASGIEKYKEFTVEKISELRVSEEGQEGINAFLEKRKPKWRE